MYNDLDNLFRNSSRHDRSFPVNEAGWLKIALELEQQRRRRIFFWAFFPGMITLILMLFWLWSMPKDSVEEPTTAQSRESASARTEQQEKPVLGKKHLTSSSNKKMMPVGPTTKTQAHHAKVSSEEIPQVSNPPKIPLPKVHKSTVTSLDLTEAPPVANVVRERLIVQKLKPSPLKKSVTAYRSSSEQNTQQNSQRSLSKYSEINIQADSAFLQSFFGPARAMPQQTHKHRQVFKRPKADRNPLSQWQVSFSFLMDYNFFKFPAALSYYSTDIQPDDDIHSFSLPSGRQIDTKFGGSITNERTKLASAYKLSLQKQFPSGFNVRAGIAYYPIRFRNDNFADELPNDINIFYSTVDSRTHTLRGELAVQYTFLKRKRLQPFLGATYQFGITNVFRSTLSYHLPRENFIESTVYRGSFPGNGISSTLGADFGFQYLLLPKVSVGPVFNIDSFSDFAWGIESRFRW